MVHDLRLLLRDHAGRQARPTAAILDSRTLRSTPESGPRAGWDGAERRNGSKIPIAVGTLGHLLAAPGQRRCPAPANDQDRAQVEPLAAAVQAVTGRSVELAYVDQGHTGEEPVQVAAAQGIRLEVVKHPETKRGFVLVPRRPPWPSGHGPCGDGAGACCADWVVERNFAWATRFRRLVRDYERLPGTVRGLHVVAFARLMLHQAAPLLAPGP
jgi:transposase